MSDRTKLSNFVAQRSCLSNCYFSVSKQSPNKHSFYCPT